MSTRVIIIAFLMTLTPGTLRMFLWDHSLVVVHWVFIQITPEQSSLYYSCRLQNKAILLTFLNIISSVGAQFKRTETPDWRLSLVYPLQVLRDANSQSCLQLLNRISQFVSFILKSNQVFSIIVLESLTFNPKRYQYFETWIAC